MLSPSTAIYYLFHPQELRAIIQWKTWHDPVHKRDQSTETETEKRCFHFLDKTSRSFSAVIMELHPELLLPVCVFYLVLRGLDTIEDDVSIPIKVKEPLLRGFKDKLEVDGWTFDGNRPEEKDRDLLLEFHNVITEFKKMKPAYQKIIKDIADRMGNGMADYCVKADMGDDKVETIEDYDLYCYYVAGLVGEGLTRLFVEAGFARPQLLERPQLFKSMGLFLQKTNIIRDVREDQDDNRRFWPKEIWSRHVDQWEDLFKPEHRDAALNCGADMIHNALEHADECLFYLAGLREQSVFNFCAIPQSMAIATLDVCFRNPTMFDRNVKITKGEACRLMSQSTQNVRVVCDVFRQFSRSIHSKNTPKDPSFLKISVACGQIEKFIEYVFPSQSLEDAKRRMEHMKPEAEEARDKERSEAMWDTIYMLIPLLVLMVFMSVAMFGIAWYFGARFDLAWKDIRNAKLFPDTSAAQSGQPQANQPSGHGEL